MNKRLVLGLSLILALLPLALVAALYGRMPAEVPMNWGFDGAVVYGPRSSLWTTAILSPVLLFLLRVLPKIDPRKKNYARFQTYYDGFCLVLMVFLLGMNGVVLIESLRPGTVSVGRVIVLGIGVLFLFIGNLMPKVKNNFFMGVRTPWTLSDPDVWNRTNRLGGQCFFWYGLALVAGALVLPEQLNFALTLAGAAVVAVVPTAMSYFWFRKKQKDPVDKDGPQ